MTRPHALVVLVATACGSSQHAATTAPAEPEPAPVAAAPAKPRTPRYDAKTFYDTVSIAGASFSSDGTRILTSTDASGVFNVYSVPVSGGAATALTTAKDNSHFAESYFPDDARFLYSVSTGGNELDHIWVRELDGSARDLTPGDEVKADFVGWSKDKSAFYLVTNEREPKFFDVYRYAASGYARTLLFKNDAGWAVAAVSPDEKWMAVGKVNNNADADVYLIDVKARKKSKAAEPKLLTRHKGMVLSKPVDFTPDGKRFIYTTDGAGEFAQAWSYDLATAKHTLEAKADWDVVNVSHSENGLYRVVNINQDGRTVLEISDTRTGEPVVAKDLPPGDITGARFDLAEKQMAFFLSSDRTPADLYLLDLASGAHKRLTSNLNPEVDPANLVDGEVVRYKSFDGLSIPAILYKPRDAAPDAKTPAVVWVHGGPGGQSRMGYNAVIQLLTNHGYAVLAVNNRGSSGYGKTFYHLDDKKHGDVDLKDCIWGRRYLETLDWVDGSKVAIMGGSYGGYMVAAALAFEPDSFDAGIDIFGVTNWIRTLESMPPWWAAVRDALYAEMGNPAEEKERLTGNSPLFHAKNIKKPLLVVQGKNDQRVIKIESDELVDAVKKNGVPVEYLVFDDEGHGFLKKENRITAAAKYIDFLDKYLSSSALK